MVAEAEDVNWDLRPNEFAALIREMRLIRTWQPEYNVQHKRDRRYGFIKITREPAPAACPRLTRPQRRGELLRSLRADGVARHGRCTTCRWRPDCATVPPTPRSTSATSSRSSPAEGCPAVSAPTPGPVPRPAPAAAPPPGTTAACASHARSWRPASRANRWSELAESREERRRPACASSTRPPSATAWRPWRSCGAISPASGARWRTSTWSTRCPATAATTASTWFAGAVPCANLPWPKSDRARRRANEVVEEVFRAVPADRDGKLEGGRGRRGAADGVVVQPASPGEGAGGGAGAVAGSPWIRPPEHRER